jgi:hypothetical protein
MSLGTPSLSCGTVTNSPGAVHPAVQTSSHQVEFILRYRYFVTRYSSYYGTDTMSPSKIQLVVQTPCDQIWFYLTVQTPCHQVQFPLWYRYRVIRCSLSRGTDTVTRNCSPCGTGIMSSGTVSLVI